jgi:hypothetical protein
MHDSPAPRLRRWFQYKLSCLFVVVTMAAILMGVLVTLFGGNQPALVAVDSAAVGNPNGHIKVREVGRADKWSMLQITGIPNDDDGSHELGLLVSKAVSLIGKARQAEYCVMLQTSDIRTDGSRTVIFGFTNRKDADIAREFGESFSLSAQIDGRQFEYLRVADLESLIAKLLEGQKSEALTH